MAGLEAGKAQNGTVFDLFGVFVLESILLGYHPYDYVAADDEYSGIRSKI